VEEEEELPANFILNNYLTLRPMKQPEDIESE
jgi:hypothetical protein